VSASEIIEQIKSLPPSERVAVAKFIVEQDDSWIPEEFKKAMSNRGELGRQLMGAGRRWLKPGADPIGDLIREREQDDKLDQADGRQ
jgi:hypothetical protein